MTKPIVMVLTTCEACDHKITKDNSKFLGKAKIGRKDFLLFECGKCLKINKVISNQET